MRLEIARNNSSERTDDVGRSNIRVTLKIGNSARSSCLALILWLSPELALAAQTDPIIQSSCGSAPYIESKAIALGSLTVPVSIEDGVIVVDVIAQGLGPFPMIVDSGAVNVITPELAKALGLKVTSGSRIQGAAERTLAAASTYLSEIRVADSEMKDQRFLVLSLPRSMTDRGSGTPSVGVLGYQLFTNFVVRLDYQKSLMTLTAPQDFHYAGSGVCVPFVLRGRLPSVKAQADGIPGLFAIDTGSDGGLVFERTFVERNSLESRHPAVLKIMHSAVDGLYETIVTRIDRFDIANATIERPLSEFPLGQSKGLPIRGVSGSIGSRILRQFIITFDYSRRELWFEQSPAFGKKTAGGTTGFQVNKIEGPNFHVINVIADTPATVAGIQVGDVITEADGISAEALSAADFAELMRRPEGTTVHLRLIRNGSERFVNLTLRELVP